MIEIMDTVGNDQLVHPNECGSLRAALLWQYSQFGSGVAPRRFRQRKRGAIEPLRVFVNELPGSTGISKLRYAKSSVTSEGKFHSHSDG